jgi:hypothetical protein
MNRHTQHIGYLERSAEDDRLRRALAARLDRALKRAGISSAQAAKWLGVACNYGDAESRSHRSTPLRISPPFSISTFTGSARGKPDAHRRFHECRGVRSQHTVSSGEMLAPSSASPATTTRRQAIGK